METSATYTSEEMYVSSDERKIIRKIQQIAEEHPDEVTIIAQPEDNDGCIYARMPASYFKLKPPTKRNITDEQREMLAERARTMRSAKQ